MYVYIEQYMLSDVGGEVCGLMANNIFMLIESNRASKLFTEY